MAKVHENITDELREWIEAQHIVFVASAPLSADGHVNLSPKGSNCVRVLDENTVAYIDMTGSGNETSAHIAENGRITMMWCSFEAAPRILRCYGKGEVAVLGSQKWHELAPLFPDFPGARQIVINHVTRVQTSCGFAVPFMDYVEERDALIKYALNRGEDGMVEYRQEKNMQSLDGLPTHLSNRLMPDVGDD
jgi:hypothetical protein